MVHIDNLIDDNKLNHHKLLVLIGDQEAKKEQIIAYLTKKDWEVFDVEETVLNLISEIPENKIYLRLGDQIKNWVNTLGDKVILTNSNILFSPTVRTIKPTEIFAYTMRGRKQGILLLEARLKDNQAVYSTPDREDYCKMDLRGLVFEKLENVLVGGDQQ